MFGSFSLTLHAVAGVGAWAMGLGVLLRAPNRPRNRWFAMLCAALVVWNFGFAARLGSGAAGERFWTLLMMVGSCAAAPLALGFATRLAAWPRPARQWAILIATAAAAALWGSTWTSFRLTLTWAYTGIAVLGGIAAWAVLIVAHRAWGRPPGPERRALLWVTAGGALAVLGGISDFLPRSGFGGWPELGPIGVLAFLLAVAAVIVRHRFLDVDLFILGAASWLVGAAVLALVFEGAVQVAGPAGSAGRFGWLFVTSLIVIGVGGPLGRMLLGGIRSWLNPADELSPALVAVSRGLHDADAVPAVWSAIDDAARRLPSDVRLQIYWADETGSYRRTYDSISTAQDEPRALPPDTPLARVLRDERAPLSERFLADEAAESGPQRATTIAGALETFRREDIRLVIPLVRDDRLHGWIAISGDLDSRYLTAEVAAAVMAVGHQAADALDRIAAREEARRREKLAAVGELSAGLAHEVRNPVTAIRGAAQAIGPHATPEQRDAMLEVIEEETVRLERFVGEFLDYARPHPPRRQPIDLVAFCRRIVTAAELRGWNLTLGIDAPDPIPPVEADPDQLQRVFENLVRNAWEAAGPGGRLTLGIRRDDDGRVAIRFEDDGPGIPADARARLFTPFHTTKPGGTGLGLALVHRVIRAHGGEVRAEPADGTGATFTILLAPAVAPQSEP